MFSGKRNRKRVAIFGGAFNPPHLGHTAICKWIFSRGIADELWIVPCFIHPFGKELADFEHRLTMCRLAFGGLALPIKILDVERELGGTSITLRTIEHLKAKFPDKRFMFITGGDCSTQFNEWHNFEKVRRLVDIVTVPRGTASPIPNVSSTEVRKAIQSGQGFVGMVDKAVAVYIVTKGLYKN